ncbi:GNAT family N-acetyltransferase [Streptomyces globosus]|uniref:GNAT family N-acetyltransferase n=1 Tax=Streptomyces TaxID=1883 RepID=UPI000F739F2C|nr:GNAT family protein [Streptomyces sp. WAC05292]RSS87404.1 N-acetyltransferase [Streptomyces sp. WAC05292]
MPFSPYLVEGDRVALRPFRAADGPEFTARVRESRGLHHPWLSPPDTLEAYEPYAARLSGGDGARAGFLVCERATGAIAGFVNVNNIVRGAFQCGALGYGAFAHAAGRGLLGEGLDLVLAHAFAPLPAGADDRAAAPTAAGAPAAPTAPAGLGLHRLEANVQPGNTASIGLVRSRGFRLEGLSPDFLFVDGAWRDHERWAITAEAAGASGPGGRNGAR